MKKAIFIPFLALINVVSFAQGWKAEDYLKWDHTNFRKCALFQQSFNPSRPDYLLLDAAIFFMTNEIRIRNKMPAMSYNKSLEIAAYNHSLHMSTRNFFGHTNTKENSRKNPADRGVLAGISNPHLAENCAYYQLSNLRTYMEVAEYAINLWMNSPVHKDNLLSRSGLQFGCGTYYSASDNSIYATQDFQWFETVIETKEKPKDNLPESL